MRGGGIIMAWTFFFAAFLGTVFLLFFLRYIDRTIQQCTHNYKKTHMKVVSPSIGLESNVTNDKSRSNGGSSIPSNEISSAFIFLAAILFFLSLTSIVITSLQTFHYKVTYGKVASPFIGIESTGSGESFTWVKYSLPVIEYKVKGKTYIIQHGESANRSHLKTGLFVKIAYDPENPGNAILDSQMYHGNFTGLFAGSYMLIIFLCIPYMLRKSELSFICSSPLYHFWIGPFLFLLFDYIGHGIRIVEFPNLFTIIFSHPFYIIACALLIFAWYLIFLYVKDVISIRKLNNKWGVH